MASASPVVTLSTTLFAIPTTAESPVLSFATILDNFPNTNASYVMEFPTLLEELPTFSASVVHEAPSLTDAIPTNSASLVAEPFAERLPLLIRNKQITVRDVAADRLVNLPVQILATRTELDLLTTQTIEFYQVPLATTTIVLGLFVEVTAINTVTSPPYIRLGIAAGEEDIFTAQALSGVDTLGETWSRWLLFSNSRAATATQIIKLGVEAGAAAILTVSAYLVGLDIPD